MKHGSRTSVVTGIYSIALKDGRCYVGQSLSVRDRWNTHKQCLRRGRHHSSYLQNAWDKYGEEAFSFTVLEACEPSCLTEREQYWMDALNSAFNLAPSAGSVAGVARSPETRARMSAAMRGLSHGLGPARTAAARIGVSLDEWLAKRAAGYKWCCAHKAWHPVDCFSVDNSRGDGRAGTCRAAQLENGRRYRQRRRVTSNTTPAQMVFNVSHDY